MPFFFMLFGMVAIAVVLIVVSIRGAMQEKELRDIRYNNDEARRDAGASAGRGSGFMG